MKELLISRLIDLAKHDNRPGFEGSKEFLIKKFMVMPDQDLITLFELTVVELYAEGIH